MKINISRIIKSPTRLVVKLFILVWVFLALHITLKLTFNYWQPYVIPTPQLQAISDFIDNNRWLEIICNGILYTINGLLVVLSSIQQWWFKSKKQMIFTFGVILTLFATSIIFGQSSIATLIVTIALPLILNYRKWLYMILAFIFSNVFTFISFWLMGYSYSGDMPYIINVLSQMDYYIMLTLNYMLFNMIDFYALVIIIFKRKKE